MGSAQERRVALIAGAGFYVGPALARLLAQRAHDLVLGDPTPELVDELVAAGCAVEVVNGVRDLTQQSSSQRLVDAALAPLTARQEGTASNRIGATLHTT